MLNVTERTKICPQCRTENGDSLQRCTRRGTPLPPTTRPLVLQNLTSELAESVARKLPDGKILSVSSKDIVLYILDYSEALVFKSSDPVILGRNAPGGHATPGDLTRYGAYSMGVSRQHAEIRYTEQGYTIQDLGSANGTWINEKRLPPRQPAPLKHGDMLWLGQLIVMIYLSKD